MRVSGQLSKNGGERSSKGLFLHKNPDRVNNKNSVTVKLCESSAEDTKVQAVKHMLNQKKVIFMWRGSFVTVATTFLIIVTKHPSSRVVWAQCSGILPISPWSCGSGAHFSLISMDVDSSRHRGP